MKLVVRFLLVQNYFIFIEYYSCIFLGGGGIINLTDCIEELHTIRRTAINGLNECGSSMGKLIVIWLRIYLNVLFNICHRQKADDNPFPFTKSPISEETY